VEDERTFQPVRAGVACLVHARAQDPQKFAWRTEKYEFVEHLPAIDLLTGSSAFRAAVEAGKTVSQLCALWEEEAQAYRTRRLAALLYDEE
jgi:uncharacterized protein YbbC (DUF1343 family)